MVYDLEEDKMKAQNKTEAIGKWQEAVLALMNANSSGKPKPYKCHDCRDMLWLDVVVTEDGEKITDQNKAWEFAAKTPEAVKRRYCVPCESCASAAVKEAIHERGQFRDGEYVDLKLITKYWGKKKDKDSLVDPIPIAKKLPEGSVLLYGETGRFKTMILQYWYNRILAIKMGDPSRMHWIHENQITHLAQNDACLSLIDELRSRDVEHFFYDEFLYPINWRSREKGGHYSDMVSRGFMNLFEFFSSNKSTIKVYASGNYKPQDVLKDVESEPLLRRQLEVFNSGEGVKQI